MKQTFYTIKGRTRPSLAIEIARVSKEIAIFWGNGSGYISDIYSVMIDLLLMKYEPLNPLEYE